MEISIIQRTCRKRSDPEENEVEVNEIAAPMPSGLINLRLSLKVASNDSENEQRSRKVA